MLFNIIYEGKVLNDDQKDTPKIKLEEKLGRVIGSLEYIGKKEHEERLEREAYWQEQREKEAIQKELNTRKQTEFNNFKSYLYCC